jgi:hypothetical protein
MTVVTERNFSDIVTPRMRQEYWHRVKRALVDVFGESADHVEAYQRQLEHATVLGQMLAFHDDPLQVAADLAGRAATMDDIANYRRLFPGPIVTDQPKSTLP